LVVVVLVLLLVLLVVVSSFIQFKNATNTSSAHLRLGANYS
jgi:hypothetical protein